MLMQYLGFYCAVPCPRGNKADTIFWLVIVLYLVQDELRLIEFFGMILCHILSKRNEI